MRAATTETRTTKGREGEGKKTGNNWRDWTECRSLLANGSHSCRRSGGYRGTDAGNNEIIGYMYACVSSEAGDLEDCPQD